MIQVIKARFLHCENRTELEGVGYILETTEPFHIARIWLYKDPDDYLNALGNNNWFSFATVPGYKVIIQYAGSLLHGRRLQMSGSGETKTQIDFIMEDMAEFFYREKIQNKPGYYDRKFKL